MISDGAIRYSCSVRSPARSPDVYCPPTVPCDEPRTGPIRRPEARDAGHVPSAVRLVRNAAHFQWCGARLQTGLVSENESPAICSAKACRAFATWAVVWNNPRLHTPDREKVWVACGEHKQPLADYLAVRSFLKRVEPLGPV